MKQFEIWWARLSPPIGRRPVLLLTRTDAYGYLSRVIAAQVTTKVRGIPTEVHLGPAEGLASISAANLDGIVAVPKSTLETRIGALAPSRHLEVKRALGWALDWSELKDAT